MLFERKLLDKRSFNVDLIAKIHNNYTIANYLLENLMKIMHILYEYFFINLKSLLYIYIPISVFLLPVFYLFLHNVK